ncbi:MAG TPA: DNA-binding protein [Thiotrichales bacterium]|nr:DNA-binding protein [Thiotrichales bacterium]
MQQRLPERFDPVAMVRAGREFSGRLALAGMPRLLERVRTDRAGEFEVDLRFGTSDAGTDYVSGHIRGSLELTCERCLEAMSHEVDIGFQLALVESEALVERIPEEFEPLVYGDEQLALKELIEDEILLSLPMFARHEAEKCPGPPLGQGEEQEAEEPGKRQPFAVLKDLKI